MYLVASLEAKAAPNAKGTPKPPLIAATNAAERPSQTRETMVVQPSMLAGPNFQPGATQIFGCVYRIYADCVGDSIGYLAVRSSRGDLMAQLDAKSPGDQP